MKGKQSQIRLKAEHLPAAMLSAGAVLSCVLLGGVLLTGCASTEETDFYPQKPGNLTLQVNPTTVSFSASADSKEVNVTANSRWTVSVEGEVSWLKTSYTSDPQGEANGTFRIDADANLTGSGRRAIVTVAGPEKEEQVTVTQGVNQLSVDPQESLPVFEAAGGEATIKIKSNSRWTITKMADWVTLSAGSGAGGEEIEEVTVTVAANPNDDQRITELTVSCPDDSSITSVTIKIEQKGTVRWDAFQVNVHNDMLQFRSEGGTLNFSILSSTSWQIFKNVDWLQITPTQGEAQTNDVKVSVNCNENREGSPRTAKVTVRNEKGDETEVNIAQDAAQIPTVTELNVSEITYNSALVTAKYSSSIPVLKKGIRYRLAGSAEDWLPVEDTSTSGSLIQVRLTDLRSDQKYEVMAYCTNEAGEGLTTRTMEFTTSEDASKRLAVISDLAIGEVTATTAVITANYSSNTAVTEKGVSYRAEGAADWLKVADTSAGGNSIRVELKNLVSEQKYEARAYCVNAAGETTSASVVTFTTLRDETKSAPAVSEVTVTDITDTSAKVAANISSYATVTEKGVLYRKEGSDTWNRLRDDSDSSKEVSLTVSNLGPGQVYEVKAYARNQFGETESPVSYIRTTGDAPSTIPGFGDNPTPDVK